MPTLISGIENTELFVGSPEHPLQVLRVYLTQDDLAPRGGSVRVTVAGGCVATPEPCVTELAPGERERGVELGVDVGDATPGSVLPVEVTVESLGDGWGPVHRSAQLTVAEPGWTMFMVSHFHFDPVWWNTQSNYTEDWKSYEYPRLSFQTAAFDLLDRHIDRADDDPDYTFVIAEMDYLKPYWDARPEQRGRIRSLVAQGRLEVMGGTYNEPSTNLSSVEATARSAVYGAGFQRGVMGADPQSAWQLDVFGHDPQFPGLMQAAGLTTSSWARGPFHQNGPTFDYLGDYPLFFGRERPFRSPTTVRDPNRMNFPSEFEWISPGGGSLMTSYMHNHYLSGWSIDAAQSLEEAELSAYQLFTLMKRGTATKNLLLPVGTDYAIPGRWVTDIARDWARKYVWPRFVTAIPRDFFAAVRSALDAEGRALTPQTRDMNPIWTGKDVSLIDTKQAQREIETVLVDAEKFAALAALRGTPYPEAKLDLAWRQVFFGSHHDAVTGTGSDQVYVDLLGSWREAHDTAHAILDDALGALAAQLDVDSRSIVVANPLAELRTDLVRVAVTVADLEPFALVDEDGSPVPFVVDAVTETATGAELDLGFVARDVPALGLSAYRIVASEEPLPRWERGHELQAANEHYAIAIDPERGGALASVVHRGTGKELIPADRVGAEVVVYDEYPAHPNMGEGPWMLVPSGRSVGSADEAARETWSLSSPIGTKLLSRFEVDGVRLEQSHAVWTGVDRVDGLVRVEHFDGADKLLRLRLPTEVAGAKPVVEVGEAVVGRPVGFPDVDSATAPWTLDTPANRWFGVGSTVRVRVESDGAVAQQAVGVAEVVLPHADAPDSGARELVVALAAAGVTATVTSADGPRYGNLDIDSNLPDVRIAIGNPADNPFVHEVLAAAADAYRVEFDAQLDATGSSVVWVPAARSRASRLSPMADLRGVLDLPVLIVSGAAGSAIATSASLLAADLADARIELRQSLESAQLEDLEDFSVALVNRGTPGSVVDSTGALHLSLMRSSTGWPSGVWIDPPRRTVPDGSTFHQQHWTHDFDYSIVAGSGDWREAALVSHGHAVNHPLRAVVTAAHYGGLPSGTSLLGIEPAGRVHLGALKLTGNPIAESRRKADSARGLTLRLTELTGRPVTARISAPGGWSGAQAANLLEQPLHELPVTDGRISVSLGAAEIGTVIAEPAGIGQLASEPVDTQSHYSRWWLHNRGSAPAGFMPVGVHFAEREVAGRGTSRGIDLTIASDLVDEPTSGRLQLIVPDGWTARPLEHEYALEPGQYSTVRVDLTIPEGAAEGTYPVVAQIIDSSGLTARDVARAVVGTAPLTPAARAAEVQAGFVESAVALHTGETLTPRLTIANTTPAAIDAELTLIAPFAAWGLVPAPQHRLHLAAQTEQALELPLGGKAPVGEYWVVPKVMWNGEVGYGAALRVEVVR